MAGGYVYVTSEYQGFQVIDVSDPASPVEVGSHNCAEPHRVTISGDRAYVAGMR